MNREFMRPVVLLGEMQGNQMRTTAIRVWFLPISVQQPSLCDILNLFHILQEDG